MTDNTPFSNVRDLISRIESERENLAAEIYSDEGIQHLKDTMRQYNGEFRLITSEDIIERLKNEPPKPGYMTGIEGFDKLTGGLRPQQVISVAAHSKHGKSEMGMFLTHTMKELNPVMIPIEQNAEELVAQRIERGFEIPHFLSPERLADFVTTQWIEERVVEGIAKYNSKMVVIDHLGYINNLGEGGKHARENLAYRIGMVMKELKNLAKKWDIIIVLLVHISQTDEGRPPTLMDIGNSSDILKESDTVILLWRKNSLKKKIRVHENKTLLNVAANRRFGRNGNVGLVFDTERGVYYEDSGWVESMVASAEAAVADDDTFNDY